jgi:hypothetical protein
MRILGLGVGQREFVERIEDELGGWPVIGRWRPSATRFTFCGRRVRVTTAISAPKLGF